MKTCIKKVILLFLSLVIAFSATGINAFAGTLPAVERISAVNAQNGIKVKWSAVNNAKGYRLYKETAAGWKLIADTQKRSFTDRKTHSNKSYTYRVCAYGKKSKGYYSKTATRLRVGTPEFTEFDESLTLNVFYTLVNGGETYDIYRSNKKNGSYKFVGRKYDEDFFEDKNTVTCETYYYKVRANIGKEHGALSKPFKVNTTYHSGACAISEHKARKIKSFKATAITDGYDVYSCQCGYEYYVKMAARASGLNLPKKNSSLYELSKISNRASVNYLNTILKRDKRDLLQVRTGTEDEIRYLKKETDTLVSGCKTDYEKANLIIHYVAENTVFDESFSSFSTDVYREKRGSSYGRCNLACDMLRLENIPTALICGVKGDIPALKTKDALAYEESCNYDNWLRVYVNGKWQLADIDDGVFESPQSFSVTKHYYTLITDYAYVYSKGMYHKNVSGFPLYFKGRYYGVDEKCRAIPGSFGTFIERQSFNYFVNDADTGRKKLYLSTVHHFENFRLNEVFAGGAIYGREDSPNYQYEKYAMPLMIVYYNGMMINNTTFTMNGKHYINNMALTYKNYSGEALCSYEGGLALQVGDTITFEGVSNNSSHRQLKLKSSDKSVISVGKNGKICALKEGCVCLTYNNDWQMGGIYIYVKDKSYQLKKSQLAPKSAIKSQRCKITKKSI